MATRKSTQSRKKSSSTSSALNGVGRALAALWRLTAKGIGSSVRFIFREARDLDQVHQRDGLAFLLVILGLVASASSWLHIHGIVGNAVTDLLLGTFGRIAILSPLLFFYFAGRLFRVPQESRATSRITIGTVILLLTSTGLIHIFNGSVGDTGKTAMQSGGGWIGYGVATPLVALVTSILSVPILILLLFFGILIVTATPVSQVFGNLKALGTWGASKAKAARPVKAEEEYEEFVKKMPKHIAWENLSLYETEDNTTGSQSLACTSGECELVDIGA